MAEKHELAKQDYLAGMKYQDIADKYGVSLNTVKSWQKRHGWSRKEKNAPEAEKGCTLKQDRVHPKKNGAPFGNQNAKGHGAPKGNKNAFGNNGGAPKGNKNSVTTGEYESIWVDMLTEEEQVLCSTINTDTLSQIEEDIRLITLRERRMMERIRKLMDGLTEKERKVLSELQTQKTPVTLYDEKTGTSQVVMVPETKLVITEITETECRAIDDILKIEEALTRVQDKKTRQLALKHSIETVNKGGEGEVAAKDHAKRVEEAWANR